jgi:hypothetical protein
MTYEVNFTDPDKLPLIIPPRTINTTSTDVALYGFTRVEYGQPLNEAFLHLLENYAAPAAGIVLGDYNRPTDDPILNKFIRNPTEGQFWFNKTRNSMFVYYSAEWHEILMGSHVAANWGVITDGQSIPRPVSRFGYNFPYSECSWSVAPRLFDGGEPDWYSCLTDVSGRVDSKVRYKGQTDIGPLMANYLILGVRHNESSGTVRDIPCPPASLSISRRLPTDLAVTALTTGTVTVDFDALPGAGTRAPITYLWTLPSAVDWDWTSTSSLTGTRQIGQLRKADPTTDADQTATFTCTMTDGCGQTTSTNVAIAVDFSFPSLPVVTLSNCARSLNVNVVTAGTTVVTNTITASSVAPSDTWEVVWDTGGITDDCGDITHVVLTNNDTTLSIEYTVSGTVDSTCTYTIPYRIRDPNTLQQGSIQTCTTTIVRNVTTTPIDPLNINYPCTIGAAIGNAGGPAVAAATLAPDTTGGTPPYVYTLDPLAAGAGFDDSACTGLGVVFDTVAISSSTGIVSFNATPPGAGSGECTIDMVTIVTDDVLDTDSDAHTKLLRWGTPADLYVSTITATCPASIVTINTSGALVGSRTATVTIPIVVRDNMTTIMTADYEVDWEIESTCGGDITFSATTGTVTGSSVVFDVIGAQGASFPCTGITVTMTARNIDESWSDCRPSTTCAVNVTLDSAPVTPLTLTYNSGLSTSTVACEACDTTPCAPQVTLVVDVTGGQAPYTLTAQSSSSTSGNGWTLENLGACLATDYAVVLNQVGTRVTATVTLASGLTAVTCGGDLTFKITDNLGATISLVRGFALTRTVCPPPCYDITSFAVGFMYSDTTTSTSCNGANFNPVATNWVPKTSAPAYATSFSASVGGPNRVTILSAYKYWQHPAARVVLDITVPGVGTSPVTVTVYRPAQNAAANGTMTGTGVVTIGPRTFTVTLTATVTYLNTQQIDGNCNDIHNYAIAASFSISPVISSCSTPPPTTTTDAPPGGGEGCFLEDSLITKADGSRVRIDSIVPGDVVRSYNAPGAIDESESDWRYWYAPEIASGEFTNSTVVSIRRTTETHHYIINGEVKVTGEHPVMGLRNGTWSWIRVRDLKVGDVLFTASRNLVPVSTLTLVPGEVRTVRLNVEDVDAFFAGSSNLMIFAHNLLDNDIKD